MNENNQIEFLDPIAVKALYDYIDKKVDDKMEQMFALLSAMILSVS